MAGNGAGDAWQTWTGSGWGAYPPAVDPAAPCAPLAPPNDWITYPGVGLWNHILMGEVNPVVTCIPTSSSSGSGLQAGCNFLVTFVYSETYGRTSYGAPTPPPSPTPTFLSTAMYHAEQDEGGAWQGSWYWWGGSPAAWQSGPVAWRHWDGTSWHVGSAGEGYANLLAPWSTMCTDPGYKDLMSQLSYRPTVAKSDSTVSMFLQRDTSLLIVKYDHASMTWTQAATISGVAVALPTQLPPSFGAMSDSGIPFVVGKDLEERLWVAWHDAGTAYSIKCIHEDSSSPSGWTDPEVVYTSDGSHPILVQALEFVSDGGQSGPGDDHSVPVLLFAKGDSTGTDATYRLYCASKENETHPFWAGETPVARTAPQEPSEVMSNSQRTFMGTGQNGNGFGACDGRRYYYCPATATGLTVLPPGLWDITAKWGGDFSSLLHLPGAVSVDDVRGWVYNVNKIAAAPVNPAEGPSTILRWKCQINGHYSPHATPVLCGSLGGADQLDGDGDGIPDTTLPYPRRCGDLAINKAAGRLYLADGLGRRIRCYDATSTSDSIIPTLLASYGPDIKDGEGNTVLTLAFPQGVAVGANGYIYIVDSGSHRVVVLDANGHYARHWGSVGREHSQFLYPFGVGVDDDNDRVYVADPNNGRVQLFTRDGTFVEQWGSWEDQSGETGGYFSEVNKVFRQGTATYVVSDSRAYCFDTVPLDHVQNSSSGLYYTWIQQAIDDAYDGDTLSDYLKTPKGA